MISRTILNNLAQDAFKGKTIILIGARQVGKSTLLRQLISTLKVSSAWLNADEADVLAALDSANTSSALLQVIGADKQLVILDEAQQVPDIGKKLKLLHDTYPEIQLIATGSSAFELQNQSNEPLTGRKWEHKLYPISFEELSSQTSILEQKRLLYTRLIYGSYPEVINHPGKEKEYLIELVNSYLYKDVLQLEGIRKSSFIQKLLQALAFQIGSEVNYHELAKSVGNIDPATVEKYLNILEKAYVVFKLPALSQNLRNEIKKGKKYFFYDNGVRNVLISNFNNIEMRSDHGVLWENYLISERLKYNAYHANYCNTYFWRTHDQAEIDYIEEREGAMYAYEIKWKKGKTRFPASFLNAYPNHKTEVINRENFVHFITKA